jgi:type IV pilus assembly protein PilO
MKFGIRELILVSAMIALLICSYLFVFTKANQKREKMLSDIATWKRELTSLEQKTAGIDNIGRKIEELRQAISFFENKLPQEREVDKILKEVWQMAEANSLQTRTVKTLKSDRGASYSEQPIQMSLSGDFNGFYAFLLQLEKLPRITRITQMRLEKINDREGEMNAQVTLSIFFEPETTPGSSTAGQNATASAK